MYSSLVSINLSVDTVKLLPQASDDYNLYLITALQYLMSMGIYNLPRGKKKTKQNCSRLHFIETCNAQTENRNANTAALVNPTGIKSKTKTQHRKTQKKKKRHTQKKSIQKHVKYSSSSNDLKISSTVSLFVSMLHS